MRAALRGQAQSGTALYEAIKKAAWTQISASGAAALSLRAIARSLGITAPAIYNYFHRRDDLVTALILDAYEELAQYLRSAVEAVNPVDHAGQLRTLGVAYRMWAVGNPERYQLVYGAPYPGYRLPLDVVAPVASRSLGVLLEVLEAARKAGVLTPACASEPLGISLHPESLPWNRVAELYGSAPSEVLHAAVSIWARAHGSVSIELSRRYPLFVTDPERLFRLEVEAVVRSTISA